MLRVGIDVGGTFTDVCCIHDQAGQVYVAKVPSTPANQAIGMCDGLRRVLATKKCSQDGQVGFLAHGTTVGTNAVLERKGAAVGCIVTEGFRDLLEIGRQRRPHLYDLYADKPAPVISREFRLEIEERMLPGGKVLRPLSEEVAMSKVLKLGSNGRIEALAICLLYSFANPEHEKVIEKCARELFPGLYISASYDVCPEIREFERLSTTVLNAYVGPVMMRYLKELSTRLEGLGVPAPLIMQSNGGLIDVGEACRYPVRTLFSGPAAGVVGARYFAELAGFKSVITLDIGGTSADISFVQDGQTADASEGEIEGLSVKVPMINICSIGAGGGSVARIDAAGLLKVGPESAGADPGPACYGRGGTAPCVTDAQLVLGRLNPRHLVGGDLPLDYDAAVAALSRIGESLGVDVREAARGVLMVTRSNLVRAMRRVLASRGLDPRDFALVAYGGAGPLHAAELADELGISTVVVPPIPGVLCAFGLLVAGIRRDFVATRVSAVDSVSLGGILELYEGLENKAHEWLRQRAASGLFGSCTIYYARMRYKGQNYELTVPLPRGIAGLSETEMCQLFHAEHARRYGFQAPGEPVEFVAGLVSVRAQCLASQPTFLSRRGTSLTCDPASFREVLFDGGTYVSPVYRREDLPAEHEIKGPAVIEQLDATTVVLPDWTGYVDAAGNFVMVRR